MTNSAVFVCALTAFVQILFFFIYGKYKEKILFLKKAEVEKCNDLENNSVAFSKDTEEKQCFYNKSQSVLLMLFALLIFVLTSIFLFENIDGYNNYIKLSVLTFIIAQAATVDLKKKKIPNDLVAAGLLFRAVMYVFEILFFSDDIIAIFKNDLIGFAIGFGILLLAAIISKGSVGFGDVKLFAVIGLCGGAILTYSTLLLALIINTLISFGLIVFKKKGRKSSVPFAPAVFIGYLIAISISSF